MKRNWTGGGCLRRHTLSRHLVAPKLRKNLMSQQGPTGWLMRDLAGTSSQLALPRRQLCVHYALYPYAACRSQRLPHLLQGRLLHPSPQGQAARAQGGRKETDDRKAGRRRIRQEEGRDQTTQGGQREPRKSHREARRRDTREPRLGRMPVASETEQKYKHKAAITR